MYTKQLNNLSVTATKIFGNNQIFADSMDVLIESIGDKFNLTLGEVGEMAELVEQLVTKAVKPEEFETKLKEKLDEDNWPILGNILTQLNTQILSKLLPTLGIGPIKITAPVKPIAPPAQTEKSLPEMVLNDKGIEFDTSNPKPEPKIQEERSVPIKKYVPDEKPEAVILSQKNQSVLSAASKIFRPTTSSTPFRRAPVPPQPLSEFTNIKPTPEMAVPGVTNVMQSKTVPKAPIIEASTGAISENPIGSFLKMLSGKLSESELNERFEKLPLSLKNALRSVDSAKKVADIGRKYGLHIDQLGYLGEETALVVIGSTHPSQFLSRLSRKLGVGDEKTKSIAQEVNSEILLKIREALKQVNGESPAPSDVRTAAATVQTTSVNAPEKPPAQLDRDSILKDIENNSAKTPTSPVTETENIATSAWFKPAQTPVVNTPKPISSSPVTSEPKVVAPPVGQPKPAQTSANPGFVTSFNKPASTVIVAEKPVTPEVRKPSIIDQKLSSPTTAQKITSQYGSDPYREPLE